MNRQLFLGTITPLIIGTLIYLLFRAETTVVFDWVDKVGLRETIELIRKSEVMKELEIPRWIIYNLPDGLWSFALTAVLLMHWNNRINSQNVVWIISVPLMGTLIELLQRLSVLKGTFDWLDVMAYLIGTALAILFYSNNNKSQLQLSIR